MKKFMFMSVLFVGVGIPFAGSAHVPQKQFAQKAKATMPAKPKTPVKAQVAEKPSPFKGKAPVKQPPVTKNGLFSSSSSSSSSSDSVRYPIFVSVVANGSSGRQVVLQGDPILFNTVMDISGGISYNPVSGAFTLYEAGSYEITFGARFTGTFNFNETTYDDPCASIALAINGTEVPGTQVSATYNETNFLEGGDADWVTVSVIQTVNDNTTVSVVSSDESTGGAIQLFNPCENSDTTAFVTIKRLR